MKLMFSTLLFRLCETHESLKASSLLSWEGVQIEMIFNFLFKYMWFNSKQNLIWKKPRKIPTSSQHLALWSHQSFFSLCITPRCHLQILQMTLKRRLCENTWKSTCSRHWQVLSRFSGLPKATQKVRSNALFFVTRERMSELSYADFSEGKELDCWSLV